MKRILNNITEISDALKSEKTAKIKQLHKIILDSEGDGNFEGFQFKDTEEREAKINYIKTEGC